MGCPRIRSSSSGSWNKDHSLLWVYIDRAMYGDPPSTLNWGYITWPLIVGTEA